MSFKIDSFAAVLLENSGACMGGGKSKSLIKELDASSFQVSIILKGYVLGLWCKIQNQD